MDETTAASIKEAIRNYLVKFDASAKAVQAIIASCDGTAAQGERHARTNEELEARQRVLVREIKDLEYELEVLIHERNDKKIERKYKDLARARQDLMKVAGVLDQVRSGEQLASGCARESGELKQTLQDDMRVIMTRLLDARRNFPELYTEVEGELDLHFFTPL